MTATLHVRSQEDILQRLPKAYRRPSLSYSSSDPGPSTSNTSVMITCKSSLLARMGAPVENVIMRRELKRLMHVLESFDDAMWKTVAELIDERYITTRLLEAVRPIYPTDIRNLAHEIIFMLMINARYTFPAQNQFASYSEHETCVHQHILYLSSEYDMHLLYPLFPQGEEGSFVSRLSDAFYEQYEAVSQRHDLCNILDHTRMRVPKWITSDVLKQAARRGDFFTRIILMFMELSRPDLRSLHITPGDGLDLHLKDVACRLASMKSYDYQLMLLVQSLVQLDISVLRRHLIQHLCSALSTESSTNSLQCIQIIVRTLCESDWHKCTLETSSLLTLLRQLLTLAPPSLLLRLRQCIISTDFQYRSSLKGASFHHVRQLWVQLPPTWNTHLQVMLNMRSEVWSVGEEDKQWCDVWKENRWYVTQQARSYDDEHNLYDIIVVLAERKSLEISERRRLSGEQEA